jgi:hypothetical protein
MLTVILLVFAFVLLVIAGWLSSPPEPRLWWGRLLAWGLACAVLAVLLERGSILLR